ncbi:putative lipoyltransferase 2, mitochondrial [Venturia canescens]|uniref:putative lipoyltransferase 2, mitochondrial n=1 Tax=Venturia canescens TaxID=32260 RepID=UPI001C9CC40C|nr:putative lipoyltransferase 2, mitochondrial [Venturia canescens]
MCKEKFVRVLRAGRLNYGTALGLQRALAEKHKVQEKAGVGGEENVPDSLILVEHEPVYTVGIRDKAYDLETETKLRGLGADYHRTNRGGLITFHGPGQLVAYPIINLKSFSTSVRRYVCQIERMTIRVCAEFGIKAETTTDTGVWVEDRKICAIGIHASRYITTHGLALNCNTDLSWYDHIVPCGIVGKSVTSISKEVGASVTLDDVIPIFKNAFKDEFSCRLIEFPLDEVSELLQTSSSSNSKIGSSPTEPKSPVSARS